jgi:deoxyhypusine synthase
MSFCKIRTQAVPRMTGTTGAVTMTTEVNGFTLEVTLKDGTPTVRIKHRNGNLVLETSALSIEGMRRIGDVFTRAAAITYEQLDHYYYQQQLDLREERTKSKNVLNPMAART